MDLLALLNHLLNFVAPAAFLALVLVVAGRFLGGRRAKCRAGGCNAG